MFDGDTYTPDQDAKRLSGQLLRVFTAMADGKWRTLAEIEGLTQAPQASVSARLRDLRKEKFGGHSLDRRRRGEAAKGLHEYRLELFCPDPAEPYQPDLPLEMNNANAVMSDLANARSDNANAVMSDLANARSDLANARSEPPPPRPPGCHCRYSSFTCPACEELT